MRIERLQAVLYVLQVLQIERVLYVTMVLGVLLPFKIFAGGVDWRGQYRFEYIDVSSSYLDGSGAKAVFLNRVNLRPHIIAADGLRVISNIEIFGNTLYPHDQMGSFFGQFVQSDQTLRLNQASVSPVVREAFLRWEQEHAELILGRSSFQFGMGAFYNAGLAPGDHFSDNYDMISYKVYMGNLLIQPILAVVNKGHTEKSGGSFDQMLHVLYHNQDSQSQLGLLYRKRKSSFGENDSLRGYDSATLSADWQSSHSHVYFARNWDVFGLKVEAGFEGGSTGLLSQEGQSIDLGGYGVTTELEYRPQQSSWKYKLLMGLVSGDDPSTAKDEGFQLHRNYNIAFLLGNHPLGRYDVLTSSRQRSSLPNHNGLRPNHTVLDEEAVGNMIYLAPQFYRSISDKWVWTNHFVFAATQTNPSLSQTQLSSSLGWEYDVGLQYQPYDRFRWNTELGFFLPGQAFAEGDLNHATQMVMGLQTRISIEF
jgi:hypothetical protein